MTTNEYGINKSTNINDTNNNKDKGIDTSIPIIKTEDDINQLVCITLFLFYVVLIHYIYVVLFYLVLMLVNI